MKLSRKLSPRADYLRDLVRCRREAVSDDYRRFLVPFIARMWRKCTPAERIAAFAAARPRKRHVAA